ncbi:MAG: thermonuclease family protein [Methylococcales bacterium]
MFNKLTHYLSIVLSASVISACSNNVVHLEPPKNGFHAEVIEVVSPNTLLVELYPNNTESNSSEDFDEEIIDDMTGKLYVKFEDINIPMGSYSCSQAWPANDLAQDFNHFINGHVADSYGDPAISFDYMCDTLKETLEGHFISVEVVKKSGNTVSGNVFQSGKHFNVELVRNGYALYDHFKTHNITYRYAQDEAFNNKQGLWALVPNECGFSLDNSVRCPSRSFSPSNH